MVGRLQAQICQGLVVLAAQLAIDLQEASNQVTLPAWVDLPDHFFQERVVDLQIARAEFFRKDFVPEMACRLLARIAREKDRDRVRREVPGEGEKRNTLAGF